MLASNYERSQQERFQSLAAEWQSAIRHTSDSRAMMSHQAFLYLCGMGRAAIRPALQALSEKPSHLVRVLRYVAAPENPVDPEHAGDIEATTNDWLAWGRESGYLD
jgi:hypothetical protein